MERSTTPDEKKRLTAYLQPEISFSRLPFYIIAPLWVIVFLWSALEIYQTRSFIAWVTAESSNWFVPRFELLTGLTVLMIFIYWQNFGERFEIGRVREATGILSRATGENSKGYTLDGKPLSIPYTMDIDCAPYMGKNVIIESAEVLRTIRGKGQATERYVVSVKLNHPGVH